MKTKKLFKTETRLEKNSISSFKLFLNFWSFFINFKE